MICFSEYVYIFYDYSFRDVKVYNISFIWSYGQSVGSSAIRIWRFKFSMPQCKILWLDVVNLGHQTRLTTLPCIEITTNLCPNILKNIFHVINIKYNIKFSSWTGFLYMQWWIILFFAILSLIILYFSLIENVS